MKGIGMLLLILGCLIASAGLIMLVSPRIPWLGSLPGDIHYRGKSTSFHLPLTTCVVVSIVLTLLLNLVLSWYRR